MENVADEFQPKRIRLNREQPWEGSVDFQATPQKLLDFMKVNGMSPITVREAGDICAWFHILFENMTMPGVLVSQDAKEWFLWVDQFVELSSWRYHARLWNQREVPQPVKQDETKEEIIKKMIELAHALKTKMDL